MLLMSARVEGIRVAGDPHDRAWDDRHLGAGGAGGQHRGDTEHGRADRRQPAATDAVWRSRQGSCPDVEKPSPAPTHAREALTPAPEP